MSILKKYIDENKEKRFAFIGAGVAHKDLISIFASLGANVTLCDKKTKEELGETYKKLAEQNVKFSLGEEYLSALETADIIFRTPGMMPGEPHLIKAVERGASLTSEVETFFDLCPAKIYAVTGSDGKTTTTSLIADMLKRAGFTVHLGGNIGKALLPMIDEVKPTDKVVAELSSFQLITMKKSPHVAVLTNITPNHLDKHTDMKEYIEAKSNILRYQTEDDTAIISRDNETALLLSGVVKGELRYFSINQEEDNGAFLRNEILFVKSKNELSAVIPANEILILGRHNVENMLAAFAAVASDIHPQIMEATAREFKGVEHRIEFVREKDGVKYYNHSIATSPLRLKSGLATLGKGLIVICGGKNKNLSYEEAAHDLLRHARVVVLMSETGAIIKEELEKIPNSGDTLTVLTADNMEEAVMLARGSAKSGDIVTLTPASTSFDKYINFEERGNHYKQIVNSL